MSVSDEKKRELRERIDGIDDQLLNLLSKRAEAAQEIGVIKADENQPIFVPEREAQIHRRLKEQNPGPLSADAIENVFREVIGACRSIEAPMRVGYLGPAGTFSHEAAAKEFSSNVSLVPCRTISLVFEEVERGNSLYGVVPIENSTEGMINVTLDELARRNLEIVAELHLPIRLSLFSAQPSLGKVKRVFSHAQPLAQCRQWLNDHFPQAELHETTSTAQAAIEARADAEAAAIGGHLIRKYYDLHELATSIQDRVDNITRFLVIREPGTTPDRADKLSIVFATKNEAGALFRSLKPFHDHQVNMTRIESRPAGEQGEGVWDYLFFIEIDGTPDDAKIKPAFEAVREQCRFFKVLGVFPVRELPS